MVWKLVLQALWFIAPAYAANGVPPVLKGRMPLDFGKSLGKYRFLGDGKTFEGTIGGILAGIAVGSIQIFYQTRLPQDLGLVELNFPIVAALSIGAIFGDIVAAFIKRRLGMERGQPAFLLDQLDFVVGSVVAASLFYRPPTELLITLLVMTPPLHWLTNFLAYKIKIKKTPW